MILFLCYARCSTCIKAKKWLEANQVDYVERAIAIDNPTYEELKKWYEVSGLPIKKWFNTSGKLYKEMNLKDQIKTMSDDECLKLLATNGMLVKRPIVVSDQGVLVGFKEDDYNQLLK